MGIIQDTDSTPPEPAPRPIQVAKPAYKGVMVDTRYTPATSLLTHVAGASWSVNYYSQVLDTDNTQSGQNVGMSAVYQQYRLIKNLELKATTPLSQTQDTTTKAFSLTGQSTLVPCGLIPNEGDMFIADVGDGREGVFRITSSEMRSIYKDSAYVIDYVLINYTTPEQITDLDNKVVESLTYVIDFLEHGQNPLIADAAFQNMGKLNGYFESIAADYFRRFVSKEYGTLIVPGQAVNNVMYDPFLTSTVLKTFDSEDSPVFNRIRELNCGSDDLTEMGTIWDALLTKKRSRLKGCVRHMGLVKASAFTPDGIMASVRYSGVNYVVYPRDGMLSEDAYQQGRVGKPISATTMITSPSRLRDLVDLVAVPQLNGLPARVGGINPILENGHYVFSEAFYNRWPVGQSGLELCVQNYLDGKVQDLDVLVNLAETHLSWPLIDQFYQVPVLLMMIRSAVRRM